MKDLIQSVHGKDYDIRSTMNYLCKKLAISSKALKDKHKEVWVTEEALQTAATQFHSLFLPLQECKIRCQEQFLGERYWQAVVKKRTQEKTCLDLKDLLKLSASFGELRLAKGKTGRNPAPAPPQWNGARDALGTVAYGQYGTRGAKPIEVKPGAAVVWNEKENRFVPETRDFNRVARGVMSGPGAVALALQEQGEASIDTAEKYRRQDDLDAGGPVYRTQAPAVDTYRMEEAAARQQEEQRLREINSKTSKARKEKKDLNEDLQDSSYALSRSSSKRGGRKYAKG